MRNRDISSFTLKIIAIIGMTGNHVAYALGPHLPVGVATAAYAAGGLTFPIMAFLICEGFAHTSHYWRYFRRMLIFALISQIPYTLLWGLVGNVFFTLAIGLLILRAYETIRSKALFGAALLAGCLLSSGCDWGIIGPVLIFLFHVKRHEGARGIALCMLVPILAFGIPSLAGMFENAGIISDSHEALIVLANTANPELLGNAVFYADPRIVLFGEVGYTIIGFALAGALVSCYRGRRGPSLKWSFYVYYPLHLFIIWLIAKTLGSC